MPLARAVICALLCWIVTGRMVRVIDGDTFVADLSVWVSTQSQEHVRLLGVDTPELRGKEKRKAEKARQFATDWLAQGDFTVEACKRDSFGRLLAIVTRGKSNLGSALVAAKLAEVQ